MPIDDARLSQIATRWSLLLQAHGTEATARGNAQAELLQRYCAPVYRYLLAITRDPAVAEELSQEFALRFVRGDFRRVDPSRGRFRDYLKTALVHLASEKSRRDRTALCSAACECTDRSVPSPVEEEERIFLDVWRRDLLDRTWASLEQSARQSESRSYTVLRLKCDDPSRTSQSIADELSQQAGTIISAASVRQILHRARVQFAELLRLEVASSLPSADEHAIDAELAEMGLLSYLPSHP